jgi:hypothetical protein
MFETPEGVEDQDMTLDLTLLLTLVYLPLLNHLEVPFYTFCVKGSKCSEIVYSTA